VDDILSQVRNADVGLNEEEEEIGLLLALESGDESGGSELQNFLSSNQSGQDMVAELDQTNHGQEKLHLAMAAGWHLDPEQGCIVSNIDEAGVRRWIRGASSYISAQLQFVARRLISENHDD